MLRCPRCRLLYEAPTPGLLPPCPQCGGAPMMLIRIEPTQVEADAPTTIKFATEKAGAKASP